MNGFETVERPFYCKVTNDMTFEVCTAAICHIYITSSKIFARIKNAIVYVSAMITQFRIAQHRSLHYVT